MSMYYYKATRTMWVNGEKKTKYIAKQRIQGTLTEKDIAEQLTKALSMEAPEVLLAMDELADQVIAAALRGQSVKVDGFGTFSPTLRTHGSETVEGANANAIEKVKINFRPDVKLKREIEATKAEYYKPIKTKHISK